MKYFAGFLVLSALGCGETPTPGGGTGNATREVRENAANVEPAATASDHPKIGPSLLPRSRNERNRSEGSDWASFLGPTGDSVSTEKGIIKPWPQNGLRVVWHRPTGTGYGMPSISNGRLYFFDRHHRSARLSCMTPTDGSTLWSFEYPTDYDDMYGYNNGPRCCPVIDGDRVYIHGAEGMLHCLDAVTGKLKWKVDTFAKFGVAQNFFGVGSAPVVKGNLLIVQIGGGPKNGSGPLKEGSRPLFRAGGPDQPRGNGTGVVAFDKFTGDIKYNITDELASYASPVLTRIGDRDWCFVFARGGLIGFEPDSGRVDFHYPWRAKSLESVNAANPVVVGDRVFISECYGPGSSLLKVKPGGYDVLWTDADKRWDKSMRCHWNTPIHLDGYLYGCSGRHTNEGELRCIEMATGKVMWSKPDLTRTSLLMVDGHFICLAEDGLLLLLKVNSKEYEEVSRLDMRAHRDDAIPPSESPALLSYPCWAAPVLSHGLLYIRSKDRLVCLQLIPPAS